MPMQSHPFLLMLTLKLTLELVLPTFHLSSVVSSPADDATALLAFKSSADPSGHLLFSTAGPTPCHWPGVYCSADGKITRLVFESLFLNGTFAPSTLSHLDQLRILSLKSNSLTGLIPDLSNLTNLKALFLDHNAFSGPIPSSLLHLHRLRTLDLSHNLLSGQLPLALARLDRLAFLRIDSNRFTGSVPPFNQSSLKSLNVSGNNLTGPVPATAVLSSIGPAAFAGNQGLCGEVVRKECGSHLVFFPPNSGGGQDGLAPATSPAVNGQWGGFILTGSGAPPSQKAHRRVVMAMGFMAGAFLVVGFIALSLALKKRRRKKTITGHEKILTPEKSVDSSTGRTMGRDEQPVETEAVTTIMLPEERVKSIRKSGCLIFCAGEMAGYTMEQLMKASAEMLGRGSLGTTYKAVLESRLIVSVKRVDSGKMGMNGKVGFEQQMDVIGRLRHPNLVPLRAYFHAKEERLLVYDYMPNGSLFSLIHGSKSSRAKPLHWTSCLKIAEDVAQGLSYIHQASRLVHGNLKSSNILLGPDFEACLTDSCLFSLLDDRLFESNGDESSCYYRAPEAQQSSRRLTPRSDIYAFGVLLLELLTGKPPLDHCALVATDLPTWVRTVREENEGADDERLTMILEIAAACVRSSPESRPTAWRVLKLIQEVKEAEAGDSDRSDLTGNL